MNKGKQCICIVSKSLYTEPPCPLRKLADSTPTFVQG